MRSKKAEKMRNKGNISASQRGEQGKRQRKVCEWGKSLLSGSKSKVKGRENGMG